ncbi:MAG: hypothetical protein IT371_23635 [Deltaproteobacteria bacterium]|nr:hypothetical protein [Deltaproteobacteria bacterium]
MALARDLGASAEEETALASGQRDTRTKGMEALKDVRVERIWGHLESLEVRLTLALDAEGRKLHDAVAALFTSDAPSHNFLLHASKDGYRQEGRLTYLAWSRLTQLEEGRADPDLELVSGLLLAFRSVLERLLHTKVTRPVGQMVTSPTSTRLRDAIEGRTTIGIGVMYDFLFKRPRDPGEREFARLCQKQPGLARLCDDESRERYAALLRANLNGVHHDEGRSRQAWPEVFRVVRWALYDELRPPHDNHGLVARLVHHTPRKRRDG